MKTNEIKEPSVTDALLNHANEMSLANLRFALKMAEIGNIKAIKEKIKAVEKRIK
tara:strand:- start:287 stop:451 length:165 start_codon:yes stop_codon:yes gene_type:complete